MHAPSPGRRRVLRSYLTEIIQPIAAQLGINNVMDWLRPYLVMRILACTASSVSNPATPPCPAPGIVSTGASSFGCRSIPKLQK